jgi:uncharacterized membrane protein HdeD (DUF308 family)
MKLRKTVNNKILITHKTTNMRIAGIILIVAGILMFIFNGINFTTEKKVVDLGPVEINKKEKKSVGWPVYAGGIVTLAGVLVLVAGNKKGN